MTNDVTSFMGTLNNLTEAEQEALLDAIADQQIAESQAYIDALDEDHPLRMYAEYYFIDHDEDDEDDEEVPPLLFATVPMGAQIKKILTDAIIPVLSTVQITFISGFGDVGITSNLEPTEKFQARVNYDSLVKYRGTLDDGPEE